MVVVDGKLWCCDREAAGKSLLPEDTVYSEIIDGLGTPL
jgi:hypothetical protein